MQQMVRVLVEGSRHVPTQFWMCLHTSTLCSLLKENLGRGCRTSPTFAVPVEDVQGRNEELVRILLLVARQVACVGPHQV